MATGPNLCCLQWCDAVVAAAWKPETDGGAISAALLRLATAPVLDEQMLRSAVESARQEVRLPSSGQPLLRTECRRRRQPSGSWQRSGEGAGAPVLGSKLGHGLAGCDQILGKLWCAMRAGVSGRAEQGMRCCTQAAAALWRLLADGAAVRAHLSALRAVSLLGSGDFWEALLLQVRRCSQLTAVVTVAALLKPNGMPSVRFQVA